MFSWLESKIGCFKNKFNQNMLLEIYFVHANERLNITIILLYGNVKHLNSRRHLAFSWKRSALRLIHVPEDRTKDKNN